MPSTPGMKADGFYNAHSSPQMNGIKPFLPWLVSALETLPLPQEKPGVIRTLDIGSSQGANAVEVLRHILPALRARTDAALQPFLSDLPTNDFNSAFTCLYPDGNLVFGDQAVFPGAIAGSAYTQLMPARSLHIATTFNMIGWLSRMPNAPLKSYIIALEPSPNNQHPRAIFDPAEAAPVHAQAYQDILDFYRARATELVPGGKLLLQSIGRNEKWAAGHGMLDGFSDTLLDLIDQGALPPATYENFRLPGLFRDLDQFLTPLREEAELTEAFTVERAECVETPVDFNQRLDETGDRTTWAAEYGSFVRAFSEPVLAPYFPDTPKRPALLDLFYDRLADTYASNPESYRLRYMSVGILLTRR